MGRPVSVLVAEDDEEIGAWLGSSISSMMLVHDRPTEMQRAGDLAGAKKCLAGDPVHLVVLDLDLPDSSGVDTVVDIAAVTQAAIVVVTGAADTFMIEQIVLAGAHDCLIKGAFDRRELARSLRVNLARHRRVAEIVGDLVNQRDVLVEAAGTGAHHAIAPAASAAQTSMLAGGDHGIRSSGVGHISLADFFPDQVSEMVTSYADLAMHRLEERGLHVDYQVATRSRKLSWDLGRLRARPRDLVEIHLEAVSGLTDGKPPARRIAISRAAESLLVETMGHLTTYYRTQQLGGTAAGSRSRAATRDREKTTS